MKRKKEYEFTEYMDNSKTMFKMLFGEKLYNELESIPLKQIDWKGIDIDCCSITATFPNIKDRFNNEWIEYFKEKDKTLLDLYLQVIFQYGYQQCYDNNKDVREIISTLQSINKEQLTIIAELTKK